MKKKIFAVLLLFFFLTSCELLTDHLSAKTAIFSLKGGEIEELDLKYTYKYAQDKKEEWIQDKMHQSSSISRKRAENLYKDSLSEFWTTPEAYGGVKPVFHKDDFRGMTPGCHLMRWFYFKNTSTGVIFREYSDYAAEKYAACFGFPANDTSPTSAMGAIDYYGGFNYDFALRYLKLIKLCEICESEYPNISQPWRQYLIKRLKKNFGKMSKSDLIKHYGQENANEIISYIKGDKI